MVSERDKPARNLAINLQSLRKRKGYSQQQLAKLTETTRATIALLESGTANPTLEVLLKLSRGLRISIEELLAQPRVECRLIRAAEVPLDRRSKHGVNLKKLLPDKIPATEIDELVLEPEAVLTGSPHIEGTREYFTCLRGEFLIGVLGETHHLYKGDVLSFPGDKPHSYKNVGRGSAHGISVVLFIAH
jgi:transcriptional regulator with XRE-family HTH domain